VRNAKLGQRTAHLRGPFLVHLLTGLGRVEVMAAAIGVKDENSPCVPMVSRKPLKLEAVPSSPAKKPERIEPVASSERHDEVARPSPAQEPIVRGAVLKHQHPGKASADASGDAARAPWRASKARAGKAPISSRYSHSGSLAFFSASWKCLAVKSKYFVRYCSTTNRLSRPLPCSRPDAPSAYRLSLPLRPPGKRPASGGKCRSDMPKSPAASTQLKRAAANAPNRIGNPRHPNLRQHCTPSRTNPDISSATENGHIECHQQSPPVTLDL